MVFDGLKDILRKRDFVILLVVFFVGLGVFNAVTTWIEDILRPRGFSATQAGIVGGVMIVGGIVGAVVVPTLSDRYRKRVPFMVASLVGAVVGLVGVTFATGYGFLLAAAALLGLSLLSAGPVGFQYGAEIALPAPEGTSTGLLLLMGQISGIAFIFAMDGFRAPGTGSMTASLVVLAVLLGLGLVLCTMLRESPMMKGHTGD